MEQNKEITSARKMNAENEYVVFTGQGILGIYKGSEKFNVRNRYEYARGGLTYDALRQKDIGVNRIDVRVSQNKKLLAHANRAFCANQIAWLMWPAEADCFFEPNDDHAY
jgi:hypothetical protein